MTPTEKEILKQNNDLNMEDIVSILLKRINNNEMKKISKLLIKALIPSIDTHLNEEINKLKKQLEKNPYLIIKKDMQMSIQKLIEQRMLNDKVLLENNTSDTIKIINNINNHIGDAININKNGNMTIDEISKELNIIDILNNDDASNIQNKLQNVAMSMSEKISENTDKLEKNKSEIDILREQIQELETELIKTKCENELDHLTSALTRKAYENQISLIEEKYLRAGNDYAIVFFDIDHFKKVNDTYGHDAGDLVLSTFAKVLLRSTREIDIIGRFGGEEFIGILHFNHEDELATYINRVKSLITSHKFQYKEYKISITFSAGVTVRSKNNSYKEALDLADELLYKAKNSGRNKIIFQNGTEL
jgi:diguanylate cyclase (GGDEF)-like protein